MKRFLMIIPFAFALSGAAAQQAQMPGMQHGSQGMPMQGMQMMMPGPNDSKATKGYKMAMMTQMQAMPKQYTGDADVDFMAQMRVHHQSAIDMAQVVLAEGKDAQVKKLAQDIISAQKKEIAEIDAWLAKKK